MMAEPVSNPSEPVAAHVSPASAGAAASVWVCAWGGIALLTLTSAVAVHLLRHGEAPGLLLPVLALLVCMLAAGFDAATSRIPNLITYPAILLGLALNGLATLLAALGGSGSASWLGPVGIEQALLGFAACTGIGIVCLLLAGMGGGDVKLLVAIGAMLGFSQACQVFLWTLLIAVPYALANLAIRGRLNAVLAAAGLQFLQLLYFRRLTPIAEPSRTSIPLAVPLTAGLFLAHVVPQDLVARWLGGA